MIIPEAWHDEFKTAFPNLRDERLLTEIFEHAELIEVKKDDVVMDYGKYIKSMPMIIKGCLRVLREDEAGNELFLYYLDKGHTCAMSLTCCMANKKSEIRAIAEEDTTMISIPVRFMDHWMEYANWREYIMETYSFRFQELLAALDGVAFHHMDERLEDYLVQKSAHKNSKNLAVSHQEIARELNTSREVVSRLLKKMEHKGQVKLGRNNIEMLKMY
jgi:CRP/FNR family transcriptional regulator